MKLIQKNGFTLVELTVVVAIFGILFVVVSNTLFNSLKAAMKAEAIKEVRQNGDVALARMIYDIRKASYWTCYLDGGTPQLLVLVLYSESDLGLVEIKYTWSDDYLYRNKFVNGISVPSEDAIIIDSKSVKLFSDKYSTFACPGYIPNMYTSPITIDFTLQYVPFGLVANLSTLRSEDNVKMRFHTTIVPRNRN